MSVLKSGTLLGDYTIVGLIARGGMGEVYEAHENKLDRRVALKVVLQNTTDHESEDLVRRFMQEARTLAKVNHPNIVTVHSIQSVENVQFIAMEFVEGVSLKQFLDEYTIPIEIALFLFEQILSGIKRLHDHGIVHRDLKPSNILIRVDGQIKILDFGIAKSDDAVHNTNPGVTVGTPPYMAPEMRSFRGSTSRSDFWSLGAIFFEALTGKLLVMFIEDDQFKFQPADLKLIPPEMRAIISGMSAPEPDDRYKSAAEILDDLHVLRQSVGQATPAALSTFRDQLRHLVDSKRTKEKSAVRQMTVPKFDIEVDTRGSERMESSIRLLDKMPPNTQVRKAKTPESRSSKRKRHNRNLLWTSLAGIVAAGIYISPLFDRYAIRSPIRAATPAAASQPRLLEPTDRQHVLLEQTQNLTLSWSRVLTAQEYDLQIALDPEFKKIVVNEPVSGNSYQLLKPLADGAYYWRLVPSPSNRRATALVAQTFTLAHMELPAAITKVPPVEKAPGVARKMRDRSAPQAKLAQLPAPRLKNPKQQFFFIPPPKRNPASKGVEKIVELSWKNVPAVKRYHLEVAYSKDMSGPVVDEYVNGTTYKWKASTPGVFYWRVSAMSADGSKGPASMLGEVTMMLPAPVLKPAFNFTLPDTPTVDWRPAPVTPMYLIQSSTKRELNGVRTKTTMEAKYTVPSTPGRYYVRVAAADINGLPTSPYSNITMVKVDAQVRRPTAVSVSLASPKPVSPMSGAAAPSKTGGISIEFTWTAVPKAESYSLQLASDAGFTDIVERSNSGEPKALLEQLEVHGRVYWRVKANTGGKSSPWSESFYFDVK